METRYLRNRAATLRRTHPDFSHTADLLDEAATALEAQAALLEEARGLTQKLYRAYVSLLEIGRDKIIDLGGTCDSVDVMEKGDPTLVAARAYLAKTEPTPTNRRDK